MVETGPKLVAEVEIPENLKNKTNTEMLHKYREVPLRGLFRRSKVNKIRKGKKKARGIRVINRRNGGTKEGNSRGNVIIVVSTTI